MALKLEAAAILILTLWLYPTTPQAQWLPHLPPPHPLPLPLPLPDSPRPLCVSQLALVNRACGRLPYARVPPPSPPSPPSPPAGEGGHHHHHAARREGYVETAAEEECCRWLKEVDTVCVCDLLVHLPPFMTRPVHEYKVVVDDSCEVSFGCASRLVKF
ncbi:uncharacterized protein LOC131010764 [Salvia miltiorrhiza]|uniref:uncharacterized protein LOC131010764 n=1 Tax=Salvia miltiorrhiza TaxID=226208 RepID=UPI0025AD6921|nr:uncharacterized protein LOC131010764 [Salvia miltiorrhiza]